MSAELYKSISNLLPTLHGWCDIPKGITLANLVLAIRPKIVLEVGVWGGRSAIPMAMACKEMGHGIVVCVDPWESKASVAGQTTEADRKWWSDVANHELVFQHFCYHVDKLDLKSFVEIHRTTAQDFTLTKEIQLAHIDGNHGPEAYTDTVKFASWVSVGGICILDDLEWNGGHVKHSEEWLLDNGFLRIHPVGTGAAYLRIA